MLQYFLRIHHQHRESFWCIVQEKLSSEIQLFRWFASQLCMLEYFRHSHSDYAIGVPMRERRLQVVSLVTVAFASASWQSNCSFICAIGFPMLEDAWAEICWANSSHHSATAQQILSWLTELIVRKTALRSTSHHWNAAISVHLSFSKFLDPTHLLLWKLDVRFLRDYGSSFRLCGSTDLQACGCAFRTIFVQFLEGEKRPMSSRKYVSRNLWHSESWKNILFENCLHFFDQSMSLYIDVKRIRSLNSPRSMPRVVSFLSESRGAVPLQCVLGNIPRELKWLSVDSKKLILDGAWCRRTIQCVLSTFLHGGKRFVHFSKKKHGIWVDVYLCCCQLDCSVMSQSRSPQKSTMPFDRCDPTSFTSVIQDQTLRNIGQCLELLEVCVLGGTQMLF